MTNYHSSAPLLADIRALNYKAQAVIVQKCCQIFEEHPDSCPDYLAARFFEDFEEIDFDQIEESLHPLHIVINDLDNVISDIDYYDPMFFFEIVGELGPVIQKAAKSPELLKVTKTPKKAKKKSGSLTPPPHILDQMKHAIELLNQQKGSNLSFDDFDMSRKESDI